MEEVAHGGTEDGKSRDEKGLRGSELSGSGGGSEVSPSGDEKGS